MATTPDNRPWAPHPIPSWVIKEFIRRQNDIGFDYPVPVSINWDDNGNWQQYKGPLTAWARVFSNGTGRVSDKSDFPIRNGFILQGGDGFDKSYGIPDNKNVLGYDSEGVEHVLNLSSDGNFVTFPNSLSNENRTVQKFLPVPGITSIDAIIQKERIRKITVNWKCYGFAQLEYMTPYFLTPKISAFVEFGWNHFNPVSLLDLRASNLDNLKELFTNSGSLLYDQNIRNSYGLYDVTMGIISGFDFTSQDGITYDCKTEILSKHANYSGVLVNTAAKVSSDKNKSSVQSTFATYLEKRLTKLPQCLSGYSSGNKKNLFGKNFMDPIDEEEESSRDFFSKTFNFYKYNDGSYIDWEGNNGSKRPEDRFFMGRRNEGGFNDASRMSGMSEYDWDMSTKNDIWVTMGFVIELANIFFNKQINLQLKDATDYNLYEIDIDDVKIGAHPNLISSDGSILLIPNKKAPKYNLGLYFPTSSPDNNDYQKQKLPNGPIDSLFFSKKTKYSSSLPAPDIALFKIFRTGFLSGINQPIEFNVFRDDLDGIINRFRYDRGEERGGRSFPQWVDDEETGKKAGYWGYLKDLYINTKVLIECAKSSDTVEMFYNSLLNRINTAAAKIWELAVVEDSEDSGKLRIVDKKYIQYNKMKIYQFDVGASNSFIKSINFTSQLSNVAANQVISSASTNKKIDGSPNGEVNSNQIIPFPYGDRFNIGVPTIPKKIDENLDSIRQLQNSPAKTSSGNSNSGTYMMSFKTYKNVPLEKETIRTLGIEVTFTSETPKTDSDINGWNIVNLVLPNESLLIALMNDMDFKNNSNIYGGQQPGFTVEMVLQGISGLRTFQLFSLKNLPSPYSEREIICQIVDVSHKVEAGNWTTTIKAGIRSIRGQSISFTTDGINEYSINIIK